ncbi:cupin-like domain-containing protein [Sphingomonas sp.]|uniref:cupin-like domain-containing protein n=1 Tax=Sphingomonas sp. TaxID=28214 RepID=UPI002EDA66FD
MAEADPGAFSGLAAVPELAVADAADLDARLRSAEAPFVVRGLVADWPLVAAGKRSGGDARAYLLGKHRDLPFTVAVGNAAGDARIFYGPDMAVNFRTLRGRLGDIFADIDGAENDLGAPPIYIASTDVHDFFDRLHADNHVDLGERRCRAGIWIGTRTRIAAHNDFPDNLACVAAGRRRFTLFPPDQFRNLYLGPLDNTPAGRAVSMVDFSAPDFAVHPRFRDALTHAQVAELEPGDAIFIPSMWYHHVEGLAPFNVLINYWWRETPGWLGQPEDALHHALLAIRDLPANQKARWRALFDHYVFENGDDVTEHLPEGSRGILDPLTPETASRIRAYLLRQLSQ